MIVQYLRSTVKSSLMSENFCRYLNLVDSWKFRTFPRIIKQKSHCGNSMSCLPDCGCSRTAQETDSAEAQVAHDESSYQPLSEASYISEAIPLLPKDSSLITYECDPTHYALLSAIGKGFGNAATIFIAQHIPSGQHVAMKCTNLDLCSEDVTYVQNEILVTKQLKHENLLPYYSAFVYENEVWAVMPLIAYGSARDIMCSHFTTGLPESAVALILQDILSALDYIHKRGFIHRSVKASHILISTAGKSVLAGLRYSCNVIHNGKWQSAIHSFPHDCVANLNWLSPELLEQNLMGYNAKSDMYSVGITACELANGVVPFDDMPPTQMLLEKLQGYPPRPLDAHTLLLNEDAESFEQCFENSYQTKHFSQSFHIFTELCLQRDPNKRPSASQLLCHTFIKQCKKIGVTLQDILAVVTPIPDQTSIIKDDQSSSLEQVNLEDLTLGEPWCF